MSLPTRHGVSGVSPPNTRLLYLSGLSFVASLGGFLFGFDTAVVSGTLSFLVRQYALDDLTLGWVVSSALLGSVMGAAIAGALSDAYGRKKVLLLSAALFVASALGCAFAHHATHLVLARLVGGLGIGIAAMLAPLYIAEISPPNLRGRMVACYQFAITLGILLAYISNAWIGELSLEASTRGGSSTTAWWILEAWRGMFGVGIVPATAFFGLLLWVPESPRWLVKAGRIDAASVVLRRLGTTAEAERELREIRSDVDGDAVKFSELFQPGRRKILVVALGLAILSQLSGINAVIYYGPTILEKAGLHIGKALGGQVLLGFVNMGFTLLAMWKVDTLGRRPLLWTGTAGIVTCLIAMGWLFATGQTQGATLIVFICGFLACFAFSLGPIPWILMSELFPTRVRGRAMSLATVSLFLSTAAVAQTFPWLISHIGVAFTFWSYAALVLPVFIIWKIMPETGGRSLEELARS